MNQLNGIGKSRWVLLAAVTAALLSNRAQAGGKETASQMTAEWWRWAYSLPVSESPLFDETGDLAFNGQPFQGANVLFLCGVINDSGTAERSITIPEGTALFFPVINSEWDNVGVPATSADYLTVPELYEFNAGIVNTTEELHATLDGMSLAGDVERIVSPPFAYQLPKADSLVEFFFGFSTPVVAPATSDGYWLLIPPLPAGEHELNFGGTFGDPINFTLDITYHITVE